MLLFVNLPSTALLLTQHFITSEFSYSVLQYPLFLKHKKQCNKSERLTGHLSHPLRHTWNGGKAPHILVSTVTLKILLKYLNFLSLGFVIIHTSEYVLHYTILCANGAHFRACLSTMDCVKSCTCLSFWDFSY
jgi:hypothetical protein